jgi:hypothetical protein
MDIVRYTPSIYVYTRRDMICYGIPNLDDFSRIFRVHLEIDNSSENSNIVFVS